ncbi:MAG: hypothetical protein M3Q29_09935 [Chloroflexota bacterium]|nr:hypothetical protein [Chloroflexota bacterium]
MLFEEVAYIAYHFGWPYEQIMSLEHRERRWWVDEVAKINRRINDEAASAATSHTVRGGDMPWRQ